jgi:hypothetical protein
MNNQLINFYLGNSPDSAGRYLSDILAWNDEELELCHDYIQWLFPLEEASQFNPDAPLLDEETIAAFLKSEELRGNMVLAFNRMLSFYNLTQEAELTNGKHCHVVPTKESTPWMTKGNHNFMRLTRILRSLNLCGLGIFADVLFEKLDAMNMCYRYIIGAKTYEFWRDAADIDDEPPPPPKPQYIPKVLMGTTTTISAGTITMKYDWSTFTVPASAIYKP